MVSGSGRRCQLDDDSLYYDKVKKGEA